MALVLTLGIAFSLLMFALPKQKVQAAPTMTEYTSGLYAYSSGSNYGSLVKSWSDLIADGDVTLNTTDWATSSLKVNNKDLEGFFVYSGEPVSIFASAFEGCSKLKRIILEINAFQNQNDVSDTSRMFYGCSAVEKIILDGETHILSSSDTKVTDMFTGCSSLKTLSINIYADTPHTFKEVVLSYSSYSSNGTPCTENDTLPASSNITFGDYTGSSTTVPSTGVVSSTLGFGTLALVVATIVLVCVSRKKKVLAR